MQVRTLHSGPQPLQGGGSGSGLGLSLGTLGLVWSGPVVSLLPGLRLHEGQPARAAGGAGGQDVRPLHRLRQGGWAGGGISMINLMVNLLCGWSW